MTSSPPVGVGAGEVNNPTLTTTPPVSSPTPKHRATSLPPSPPRSSQTDDAVASPLFSHSDDLISNNPLLEIFLQSLCAKAAGGPHSFNIRPGAYSASQASLLNKIQKHDLLDDRLLILRMPSIVHEIVGQKVVKSIETQFQAICQNGNIATQNLVRSIDSLRSSRIQWSSRSFREPDEQFKVKGFRFPGVVIEIATTQSAKSLAQKADELIVESYGDIRVVIGVDIETTGQVRVSTWRPHVIQEDGENILSAEQDINQAIVRDSDMACPAPTDSIRLSLGDFGPASLSTRFPGAVLTEEVRIKYAELAQYVYEGEMEQQIQEQPLPLPPNNLRKRRRVPSPEEEIMSADERLFKRRETEAQEHVEAEDSDYYD